MERAIKLFACNFKKITVSDQIEFSKNRLPEWNTVHCQYLSTHYPFLCQEFKNNKNTCFCENSTIIFFLDIFINIKDYLIPLK